MRDMNTFKFLCVSVKDCVAKLELICNETQESIVIKTPLNEYVDKNQPFLDYAKEVYDHIKVDISEELLNWLKK